MDSDDSYSDTELFFREAPAWRSPGSTPPPPSTRDLTRAFLQQVFPRLRDRLQTPIDDEHVPELLSALERDPLMQTIAAQASEDDLSDDNSSNPLVVAQIQLHHGYLNMQREIATLHDENEDLLGHADADLIAYHRLHQENHALRQHISSQNAQQARMSMDLTYFPSVQIANLVRVYRCRPPTA